MNAITPLIINLNALAGGFFIISAFGIVATRQVRSSLKFFIFQSVFLAASAFLLGMNPFSIDLMAVGAINIITKVWLLPWLLRKMVKKEIYTRREITQVFSIPTSLVIALILTIAAYFFSLPWVETQSVLSVTHINVPVGLAGLFLGAYTLTTRREAVPQLLGLLAMENGAFFAGVAIAPDLPLIAELALAFDILILTFVIGILTHTVDERIGTTSVGSLAKLREETNK
jgi:hydrogenase-4 component E